MLHKNGYRALNTRNVWLQWFCLDGDDNAAVLGDEVLGWGGPLLYANPLGHCVPAYKKCSIMWEIPTAHPL